MKNALLESYRHTEEGATLLDRAARGLYRSRVSVPSDGSITFTVGYSILTTDAPPDVTFSGTIPETTVQMQEHPGHPKYSYTEITIIAPSEPGTIEIRAEGESIEIEAKPPTA